MGLGCFSTAEYLKLGLNQQTVETEKSIDDRFQTIAIANEENWPSQQFVDTTINHRYFFWLVKCRRADKAGLSR